MGNCKVEIIVDGETQTYIDLTGVSVSPEHLESGYTALDNKGDPIVGTLVIPEVYDGTVE